MLVVGPNGAGKTNLLEALHVGTQGFSPRTRSDAQLVKFGAEQGQISLSGRRGQTPLQLRVDLSTAGARRATLNGARLSAAEQLRREVATLVFTPDRLVVVKGGPAVRRAYFDRALGRLAPARANLPVGYAAAVGQRNAALRRAAAGLAPQDALAPWTARVAELGRELTEARREAIAALNPQFEAHAALLGLGQASLAYDAEPPSAADLEARISRDLERGTTGLGPHLDDVAILAGDRDLRSYGSQGEQRVAVLALLLAEGKLIEEHRNVPPLLLLDDVLSELDGQRRAALTSLLSAGQTLVTTADATALGSEPDQLLRVSPGRIEVA